jgi:hypothetical protein
MQEDRSIVFNYGVATANKYKIEQRGTIKNLSELGFARKLSSFRSTSETCCVTFSLLHTGMNEDMTGV